MRREAADRRADIYTVNYENIPWLTEYLGEDFKFKTIIADESTKLKSFRLKQGSSRAHALSKVAFGAPRFIELTGTPSPNGLLDLWGQLWFLDRGKVLGKSFTAFRNRWFRPVNCGQFTRWDIFPHSCKEIETAVAPLTVSLNAADWFDLQNFVIKDVPAYLPTKAMAQYKEFEKELFLELAKNKEVEALNAASKTIKCLQIASGALYTDEEHNWHHIHDAKIEALESIINEAGGAPIIVAYHFKSDLERLLKHFPEGRFLDSHQKTEDDWNKGKIPLLFAHPASAGHGLNLQYGGNIITFFSHWWDLEQYQQIIERIGPTRQAQAGFKRPVFIYNIKAEGTIDSVVIDRRNSKRSIQDSLLLACKRS